ncbi:MAG: helix-hairpin-helix domain-containing protein, partial [Proteobacteria bacterium]|nr:helix-hairpin-helix domain-containing protein [Pseudomonadota bacterium]
HGKFKSIDELESVAGIGAKTIEKNKGKLTL